MEVNKEDLQPIAPAEGVDLYLEDRRNDDLADQTIRAHRYRLGHFIRWCNEVKRISNLNELTVTDMFRYKNWRREDGNLNRVSLHTQLSTLKVFIKWLNRYGYLMNGLAEGVDPPKLKNGEDVADEVLQYDDVADILRWLKKYHYGSRDYTIFKLMWTNGMRIGAVHSLDLDDFHPRKKTIEVRHRPETGTPLKMEKNGERVIGIVNDMVELLADYLDQNRHDVIDDYGREPFFTTRHGRVARSTIRDHTYKITRPCRWTGNCPHDKKQEECQAYKNISNASGCPSVVNLHAVRKGAITWALKNDVPPEHVSGRMNVSPGVFDKHYDKRTKEEKMEVRRKYFDEL